MGVPKQLRLDVLLLFSYFLVSERLRLLNFDFFLWYKDKTLQNFSDKFKLCQLAFKEDMT